MLHLTYLRRDGVLIQRDVPAAAAASALDLARQEAVFFWLDMDVPLPEEGALLADYFHFHKLEIEDALEDRHHPKLEELDDHLFLIVHGVIPGLSLAEFRTREMDIFLATNYLVTHHRQPSVSIQMTRQACPEMLTYLERGPAYLLYQILDRLMELYNPVLDAFGEEIGQ
ncbi:MAG TPA: CorA family divalent cation transporter, partial [bacterium]|nr:CorA family divalent cation transporter [bacterium]